MDKKENFDSCYQEVKSWLEEVSETLNDVERVAYLQATRNFYATKHVYGNALKERNDLVAYKKKLEDRLWIYLAILAALIWAPNFFLEAFGQTKIEINVWILLGLFAFWFAYLMHLQTTLIYQLDSRVIMLRRDLNALNVPDEIVEKLINEDELLRDETIDEFKEEVRLKRITVHNILEYQVRSHILNSITGYRLKDIPSCVYCYT